MRNLSKFAGSAHLDSICFYNSTKSGVYVRDERCATYNIGRASNCWPLFYAMPNVAGINSLVIYQS